ncbi:MAG: thiamine-phosphate kinase [Burkholderiaceae bacterium]
MALGEFELIEKYFSPPVRRAALGVGDDCALLNFASGMQLAVSSDMLVQGRHFLSTVDATDLGHKALAVNLSDLAACGARPLAFTLALALPSAEEGFLQGFSQGMLELAATHDCELVGGDTTQGPLTICITVFGEVPIGQALLRSGARCGDDLYVSGSLGDARLALECLRGKVSLDGHGLRTARRAMERPVPRVSLGVALRGVATSAIDVSDGLLGDLGHILRRSVVGATVHADALPRSAVLAAQTLDLQREYTLAGGDDYELLFSAPAQRSAQVHAAAQHAAVEVTCIGRIDATPGLRLIDAQGQAIAQHFAGFDHFR